jgi:hypothetical protein
MPRAILARLLDTSKMEQLLAGSLAILAVVAVSLVPAVALTLLGAAWRRRPRGGDDTLPLRRCDRCGRGWRAVPGREATVIGLRVRRRVRRWARRRERGTVPSWAQPRGWSRCPSCLSTWVRTSGEAADPEPWTGLEKAGAALAALGLALVAFAVFGAVL